MLDQNNSETAEPKACQFIRLDLSGNNIESNNVLFEVVEGANILDAFPILESILPTLVQDQPESNLSFNAVEISFPELRGYFDFHSMMDREKEKFIGLYVTAPNIIEKIKRFNRN